MDNIKGFGLTIGQLDDHIEFFFLEETRDEFGGVQTTKTSQGHAFAFAEYPSTGIGETYANDEKTATAIVTFTVRWRGDIDEKWTIEHNSKTYDIVNVAPIGRRAYEKITAKYRQV